jgi:radical SAM-linked protein
MASRYRIHYSKTAALRYTGNLDIHKIWERSLRRAQLPLAYSQGFHPQPHLTQACPLPLGLLSRAEVIDIWLEAELEPAAIIASLRPALPPGLDVHTIEPVDLRQPSLPTQVASAEYMVTLLDSEKFTDMEQRVSTFLSEAEVKRELRGKIYDLRPLVEDLVVLPTDSDGHARLWMRLKAREGATGRADEVLMALGCDPFDARVERTRLIFLP